MNKDFTRIYLIRHGEIYNPNKVFYGREIDVRLTNEGKEKVQKLAKEIQKRDSLEKIYSSPQLRAIETSQILKKVCHVSEENELVNDLQEVDIPALVNHPNQERAEIHARYTDEYDGYYVSLGNESRGEIVARMKRAYESVLKSDFGKTIALVSHGDPLRFLLFAIENPTIQEVPPMSKLVTSDYLEKSRAFRLVVEKMA